MDEIPVTMPPKLTRYTDKMTCSFCSNKANVLNPVILTDLTGKAICQKCLGIAEQAGELIPKGAVKCPGCQHYDGVKVQYNASTVKWVFSGLNKENTVGYRAMEVTGTWSTHAIPKKASCIRCGANIPLYNLKLSPYISSTR